MNIFSTQETFLSMAPSDRTALPIGSPPAAPLSLASVGSSPLTAAPAVGQEKPFHYKYLTEFRVDQCPLFLQHKCSQHRPFTCFYWHFQNQRRRRPLRRKDGHFNHSADNYCTLYDENTGVCPDGDECGFLHRTAGDTERRYHLRYYKTSTCVHETDVRGYCVKNGVHCAFAHGTHDMRKPECDIREIQNLDEEEAGPGLFGSLEREKGYLTDDPRWQNSSFVLTYYKTEPCPKPPKLCRQGYACPFFHNNKDKRRSPKNHKYRSTPCPSVKVNDEWGDPRHCESLEQCLYCHTRTEQQFHVEIYKSTKCNDVQQTGYCPRGAFCAFAHNESELNAQRELTSAPLSSPVPVPVEGAEGDLFSRRALVASSLPKPIGNKASHLGLAYSAGALPPERPELGEEEGLLDTRRLSGSVASSISDTQEQTGLAPSVEDVNSLEFDMSDLQGFRFSEAHLNEGKVSSAILATSPAAQKFLQTFSQGPLGLLDMSASAPTHPYDVLRRQNTSPQKVPGPGCAHNAHESLSSALRPLSLGEQLIGQPPPQGEEGRSAPISVSDTNQRLSELHQKFPPLPGAAEGATPFIHLPERPPAPGADVSSSAPSHPGEHALLDSLLEEKYGSQSSLNPALSRGQLIGAAGNLITSPGANSLNSIENEILRDQLKQARDRINHLESSCVQYQQAMEFMKRRMDIFEMTLVTKQAHGEPPEVSGFPSGSADPWRQDSLADSTPVPSDAPSCLSCRARPRAAVLQPCGHLVACVPCAERAAAEGLACVYCKSQVAGSVPAQ